MLHCLPAACSGVICSFKWQQSVGGVRVCGCGCVWLGVGLCRLPGFSMFLLSMAIVCLTKVYGSVYICLCYFRAAAAPAPTPTQHKQPQCRVRLAKLFLTSTQTSRQTNRYLRLFGCMCVYRWIHMYICACVCIQIARKLYTLLLIISPLLVSVLWHTHKHTFAKGTQPSLSYFFA